MKKFLASVLAIVLLIMPLSALAAPLEEIYTLIEMYYVDPVDSKALRQVPPERIGEFLNDPYTVYFSPQQMRAFLESMEGYYEGVGLQIAPAGDDIVVMVVFPNSPAERAGLRPGDILYRVDEELVRGLPLDIVSALLRGQAGTRVTVEVLRNGTLIRRTLTRSYIESPTAIAEQYGDVAYLAITEFGELTYDYFTSYLDLLMQGNPRGYIIDLRDNPGGLVSSVLDILAYISPRGTLLIRRGRYGVEQVDTNPRDGIILPNLVVLVNGNSASASEIMAGAIQDNGTGVLVGTQTYGKASVQQVFNLSDGGGLKVTVARYFTPKMQQIDKVGLTPDIRVEEEELQLETALRLIRSKSPTLVFTIGEQEAWTHEGEILLDTVPFIENGRSYIPVRLMSETMGAEVGWDQQTRTVSLIRGEREIKIPADGNVALVNGEEIQLEDRVLIRNNRTFVPARIVAESLGARVWWDEKRSEVVVAW